MVSFKSLEQEVFAYVCELGREITRSISHGGAWEKGKVLADGKHEMSSSLKIL